MKHLFIVLCAVAATLVACTDKNSDEPNGGSSSGDHKLFFQEDYLDDFDAIYAEEAGCIALFGYDSVACGFDEKSYERVIYVAKVDKLTGKPDLDKVAVIVADSTNFPVRIASKDVNMFCGEGSDGKVNLAIYTSESGTWEEVENKTMPKNAVPMESRAISTGGYSEFNAAKVLKTINVAKGLCDLAQATDKIGKLSGTVGLLGELADINSEMGLGIGLLTSGGLPGALLAMGEYLAVKLDEFYIRELGKVRLAIENIERISGTSCEVHYSVYNLNENGQKNSMTFIWLKDLSSVSNPMVAMPLESSNQRDSFMFNNLGSGRYAFTLSVHSTRYPGICYFTNPVVFEMYDLQVVRYQIDGEPYYDDGKVYFEMAVNLQGDAEYINNIVDNGGSFGYYVTFGDEKAHAEVKNLSTIFSQTPDFCRLILDEKEFTKKDYKTFVAEPSDHYIGAYVRTKNGDVQYFDEKRLDCLVYKAKPRLEIFYVLNNLTSEGNFGNGYDMHMQFNYKFNLYGTLFMEKLYRQWGENWTNAGTEDLLVDIFADYPVYYSDTLGVYFKTGSEFEAPIYFYCVLGDGSKYYFDDYLLCTYMSLRVKSGRSLVAPLESTDGVCPGIIDGAVEPGRVTVAKRESRTELRLK